MGKRDKYIQKALDFLGLTWNESGIYELNSVKDIDFILSERKGLLLQCENGIEDLKESIQILNEQIQNLENIKKQTIVEEYKDLNPNADVFYL